jgi:hypothetical protein
VIDEATLNQIEQHHAEGLTSQQILSVFATNGVQLSEATLRKYVQLGLLPRSVRVGQKGKHQGSRGIYPVNVVRQILRIKQMMGTSLTIEQIQREFLFMRSELEQLGQVMANLFKKLDDVLRSKKRGPTTTMVGHEVEEAREMSKGLIVRLESIERRLTSHSPVERVAAS